MKEMKEFSKVVNTIPPKKEKNILNNKDIYDNKKYGITKINTKINNNSFKIILLDKKINRKYNKKQSFTN